MDGVSCTSLYIRCHSVERTGSKSVEVPCKCIQSTRAAIERLTSPDKTQGRRREVKGRRPCALAAVSRSLSRSLLCGQRPPPAGPAWQSFSSARTKIRVYNRCWDIASHWSLSYAPKGRPPQALWFCWQIRQVLFAGNRVPLKAVKPCLIHVYFPYHEADVNHWRWVS